VREDKLNKAWLRYEQGRDYNNRLVPNQYSLVNTNIEFFSGNQWLHLEQSPAMQRLPKPTFNIIKRVASLFVASLTSSAASISFDELYTPEDEQLGVTPAAMATAQVQNLLEKFKMDYRIREALFDGAQTGDYCAHFFWDAGAEPYGGSRDACKGEIQMELVDGINVMFGNPNTADVERQPYILIVGRDTVENLRREMEEHTGSRSGEEPVDDTDNQWQAATGGRTELDGDGGKALYLYMYEKKDGTVHVTKATKNAVIYEDVDTGLSRYPIAWGNWEKQKNQYHGRALVTGIIPNQIFVNTMFALVMRHLQLQGFPKTVYNADLIGQWSNEVGQAIAVRGMMPGQRIADVAENLRPADMSNQIVMVIDKAIGYTKDCLGATDAQLGNVQPDNTSALMVLQSSAEVPLENTRAGLYEWLEDIGAILLDMMGTYYGIRPVVMEKNMEEPVMTAAGMPDFKGDGTMQTRTVTKRMAVNYDFSKFKHMWQKVRVNAGASTYYSEIAMVQTLDNLRRDGTLEVVDYLERLPDKLLPRKAELVEDLRRRAKDNGDGSKAAIPGKENLFAAGGPLSPKLARESLPTTMRLRYGDMPSAAKRGLDMLAQKK